MRRIVLVASCGFAIALLSGCGAKPEDRMFDVCLKAAQEKLGDQDAEIDEKSMQAAVTRKDDGTWEVGGFVVFEGGMANERKQTILCQARNAEGGKADPEVILLQFLW